MPKKTKTDNTVPGTGDSIKDRDEIRLPVTAAGAKMETYFDEDGQMSFYDPQDNYFPQSSDYRKIPNEVIEQYGNISYFANLGMMMALTKIRKRKKEEYEGTAKGMFYESVKQRTSIDYSDGLVAEFPASEFIKVFSINRNGRTYKKIDDLWNSHLLRNQWQVLYEDDEISAGAFLLSGTMYDKVNNVIYMKFNADLEERLIGLGSRYANISFAVLGKLKDEFLTTLYEVLKKHLDFEISKNKKFGYKVPEEVSFYIELEHFYFLMGMFPVDLTSADPNMQKAVALLQLRDYKAAAQTMLESGIVKKYDEEQNTSRETALTNFGYFKRHYLDRAFKKMNGFELPSKLDIPGKPAFEEAFRKYRENCETSHPTDIHFRYEQLKKGAGGKTEGLTFYISKAESVKEKSKEPLPEKTGQAEIPIEEQFAIIDEIRDMIPEKLPTSTLASLAKAAGWDIGRVKKAYMVALYYKRKHTIDDIGRFLSRAVNEDWEPAVVVESEKEEERYPKDLLKEKLGYEEAIALRPDIKRTIDLFYEVIYDTMNTDAAKIKAGPTSISAETVKEKLLELTARDIISSAQTLLENDATPSPSYIIGGLYMARMNAAIAEDQENAKKRSKPEKVNPFNDFGQRRYSKEDYDELEKRKSGRL